MPSSLVREVNRIRVLGAMPIALRPLAGIHGSDISAFITELQGLGLAPLHHGARKVGHGVPAQSRPSV